MRNIPVQETYLRAWRAFRKASKGRGSLKSWLYQIATRVCLDAITQRKKVRRLLPEANFPPATEVPTGQPPTDIAWLEPYPDSAGGQCRRRSSQRRGAIRATRIRAVWRSSQRSSISTPSARGAAAHRRAGLVFRRGRFADRQLHNVRQQRPAARTVDTCEQVYAESANRAAALARSEHAPRALRARLGKASEISKALSLF